MGGVGVTRGDVTTIRTRGTRGAKGDKSSSICSYATINKKEMGQRRAHCLTGRWRHDGSPGGVGSAIVGVSARQQCRLQPSDDVDDNNNGGGERREQRGNGRGSAAPPMVDDARQTQSTPTLTSRSASHEFCIGAPRQQRWGRCRSAGGRMV
jgi:hypothetical protein